MMTMLRLTPIALFPALVSLLLALLEKKTRLGKVADSVRQLLYGLIFGGIAILATEFGVTIPGATINARDAAPLCAGLIFGAPAGVIAGLIGGIERWFAIYWGAGAATRVACSTATIIAGFLGAFLRKAIYDDKLPKWFQGLAVALAMETLHMLLIFLTNMSDVQSDYEYVRICALPMVSVNTLGVTVALILVRGVLKPDRQEKGVRLLGESFQRGLLVCICFAYIAATGMTLAMQMRIAETSSRNTLEINIEDVCTDILDASDENLITITKSCAEAVRQGMSLKEVAEKYNVSEISLVNGDGIIMQSTNPDFKGYDMKSGMQSSEFMVLLDGTTEQYVQPYQAISYDENVMMKYAGVPIFDGRWFIQVGYDSVRFRDDVGEQIGVAVRNRHIGRGGGLFILDEDFHIVMSSVADVDLATAERTTDRPEGFFPMTLFTARIDATNCYCMFGMSEGYYIVAALPCAEALFTGHVTIYMTLFLETVVFGALFILVYYLIKKLVVSNMESVNYSLGRITGGDLETVVNVRSQAEFASLSDDINATVTTLKRYIKEAEERIDKELEFAKAIQISAMPNVFPPFPGNPNFEIFARMDTAKEVGGDFYDFFFASRTTLAFLIADVSGKGIPAALFMMTAKSIIKGYGETGMPVEEVFTKANTELCQNNDAGMFVTAWMGAIDLRTGVVSFVNAGHNPPLVRHGDGTFEYLKSRAGFVLAGMEGLRYRRQELQLQPGDIIYLYTDGVTEATSGTQELYGEDRLRECLNRRERPTLQILCEDVRWDVDNFVHEAPQFDDITMLALRYNGWLEKGNGNETDATTI